MSHPKAINTIRFQKRRYRKRETMVSSLVAVDLKSVSSVDLSNIRAGSGRRARKSSPPKKFGIRALCQNFEKVIFRPLGELSCISFCPITEKEKVPTLTMKPLVKEKVELTGAESSKVLQKRVLSFS
ncbi:hypothetical protein P5673_001595 [Acropora cervicornis]|uniref:Uncharacterized protein n=1 Tax=Acropora cervicornis TaxID=6130 RepID=A0AAD9VGN8_ACRCE|nr:hypothetical protein P5673_001595 [Acropora cervicornis]